MKIVKNEVNCSFYPEFIANADESKFPTAWPSDRRTERQRADIIILRCYTWEQTLEERVLAVLY